MDQLPVILKKARQVLGLTQGDVAAKLGITQRAYAFYEDEERNKIPRAKRLAELGKILNIPVKSLLTHYNAEIEAETSKNGEKGPELAASAEPTSSISISTRLYHEIEARRRDYEKWAEFARTDKERAEKEKDRLLNIIENNLTLLIKVVGAVDTNLKVALQDLQAIEFGQRAQHTVMIKSMERIEKVKPGTLQKELSSVERAYQSGGAQVGSPANEGK